MISPFVIHCHLTPLYLSLNIRSGQNTACRPNVAHQALSSGLWLPPTNSTPSSSSVHKGGSKVPTYTHTSSIPLWVEGPDLANRQLVGELLQPLGTCLASLASRSLWVGKGWSYSWAGPWCWGWQQHGAYAREEAAAAVWSSGGQRASVRECGGVMETPSPLWCTAPAGSSGISNRQGHSGSLCPALML